MGERNCSVPDCSEPYRAKGFCNRHYCQWKAYGDPQVYRRARRGTPADQRFWACVDADGDCWVWIGRVTDDGYGRFKIGDKDQAAHRWAWEHLVGQIPAGLQIDHLCKNRRCVNPDHLEPVTQLVNIRRGASGAWAKAKAHCPSGHPYDEVNTVMRKGRRACRECARAACRAWYHRNQVQVRSSEELRRGLS